MPGADVKRAHEITGDRTEAQLLERIVAWYPSAKYEDDDGIVWLIRCADEFIADGVVLNVDTIRKALGRLENKGLIIRYCSWHRFRKTKSGTPVMRAFYIRPADGVADRVRGKTKRRAEDERSVEISPDESSGSFPLLHETKQETIHKPAASRRLPAPLQRRKKTGEEEEKTHTLKESSEHPYTEEMSVGGSNNAISAVGAFDHFCACYKDSYPAEYVPPPNGRNVGCFKSFLPYARKQGVSDPAILEAIKLACADWSLWGRFADERGYWEAKKVSCPVPAVFAQAPHLILEWHRKHRPRPRPSSVATDKACDREVPPKQYKEVWR